MKMMKYIQIGLIALLLTLFMTGCEDDKDTFVDDNIDDASAVTGGLLYDKWWTVAGVSEPTTDNALYGTHTGTATKTGSTTWRCKECHGWDYQGAAGAYGSGSHNTGFAGVYAARLDDATDVFDQIESGENHDFGAVLDDDDLLALTKFITTELFDPSAYISLTTKVVTGNVTAGKTLYENADATAGGQCITCHGADGNGVAGFVLGELALDNPWETLHKIRFGHPGSSMPSTVAKGIDDADAVDILAYAQTLLTSGDAVAGGLLYDKWWAVATGATEPTTDNPLYATHTGTATKTGSTTWRCKECHGWDYQGAAGAYGSGSHNTGFAGVYAGRDNELAVYTAINSGTDHDFGTLMADSDILNLTAFITTELIDVGSYITLATKVANGNPTLGMALYESTDATTGGQCITCHGDDGENYDFGGLSALANGNPWETLHKIRFGHPGSAMPSTVAKNLTADDANNILAYAQTGLAEMAVASALEGVWTADATTGTLGNVTGSSGSLAGAGWTSYSLTLTDAGTFIVTGGSPYGIALYGSTASVDSTITYSGTYTIDASASPMEIDLTCTVSDLEAFFSVTAADQPMQPGIFVLNGEGDELTIQWGAKAFSVPRPTEFLVDSNGDYDSGTLVKQ